MNRLLDFFLLLGLYTVATFFHMLGHILAGRLAGLRIEKVNFFLIRIFTIRTPIFPLEIGILPIGGSVKFSDEFEQRSIPVKWLVTLGGPLLVILSALIGLSFDRILPALVSGFEQVIRGAISPVDYGAPLIQRFFAEYVATSLFAAYGILAIKLEAMNLLPIPSLNGGQLLTSLFPNFNQSAWGERIAQIGLLINLAMLLCWAVAFAVYLFK
jgi:membrane-associated protease RseP (regulator of RpoE activity)